MLALAEPVVAPLTIQLLGPPAIAWPGGPLPLARRRTRALLFRLAASPRPVPRAELAALFWPERPDSEARRGLIVLLNHLRRALPDPDLLVADNGTVGLRPDLAWSDAVAAAELIAAGPGEGRLDLLERGIALYRGPFLDGFALPLGGEFEAWMAQEREAWERRFLAALAALAEGRAARGDHRGAIEAAQRALDVDVLDEAAHRRLIAIHTAAGDRAGALRQYDACAATLERELGVQPHPETRRAYEAARDGRAPRPGQPPATPVAAATHPATPDRRDRAVLPRPAHPLLGREATLAEARAALTGSGMRLLTLCGPGGSGKTSLALQVAHELGAHYADGIVFVPLAPLHDPAPLLATLGRACGLRGGESAEPGPALHGYLRERELLLILDNCEQLADACARLAAELLSAAPRLRILATSRVLLRVRGECALPVPPLPLPDLDRLPTSDSELAAFAAAPTIALFSARAREVAPGFAPTTANAATLATICARLDGLPLAIELAAARLARLTPQAILARLDRRLMLLADGPQRLPARQRALGATIDWSYRLLGARAQRLFADLAAFADGWSLDAAEAVCAGGDEPPFAILDALQELLDAHLLVRIPDAEQPRYAMLETIREFARGRLAENGAGAAVIARRHAAHYLALARALGPRLSGPEQEGLLRRVGAEEGNLRAALTWAREAGEGELGLALALSLGRYWDIRGLYAEGYSWLMTFLARATTEVLRGKGLIDAARLARHQGDYAAALRLAGEATALCRAREDGTDLAAALTNIGLARYRLGDLPGATAALGEAVALRRCLSTPAALSGTLNSLAEILEARGDYRRAVALYEESLALKRARGDVRGVALLLNNLAGVARDLGEHDRAVALAEEALALARRLDDRRYAANALRKLALVARDRGELARAVALGEESLALRRAIGDRRGVANRLLLLAEAHRAHGDHPRAVARYAECLDLCRVTGDALTLAGCLEGVAGLCAVHDRPAQAARFLGMTAAWRERGAAPLPPPDRAAVAATAARARTALGDRAWLACRADGGATTLPEAGAEATTQVAELVRTAPLGVAC